MTSCSNKEGFFKAGNPFLSTLCMQDNFEYHFNVWELLFFKLTFQNNFSVIPSECQSFWVQIRHFFLSGLMCVQAVYKGFIQQVTKVITNGEKVNKYKPNIFFVGHMQIVQTQIRHCRKQHLIRFCTVCLQCT